MTVVFLTEGDISETDPQCFPVGGFISLCRCGVRHHVFRMFAAFCDV